MPHYAVNPQTGERLMLMGDKWVPATPLSQGSPYGAPKLTEAQAKDGFNAKRLAGASGIITPLEEGGYDAGAAKLVPGFLPGHDDKRRYEAAANEWADSLLRMTTGAAATKDEINNAVKTYFPQLGDSEAVRREKAAMRRRVEQDAMTRAGPAASQQNAFDTSRRMGVTGRRMAADAARARRPAPVAQGKGWKVLSVE